MSIESFPFPPEADISINDKFLRRALLEVYKRTCYYTWSELDEVTLRVDHIIPKSKWWPDNVYNYVPTNQRINGRKCAKLDESRVWWVLYQVALDAQKVLKLIEQYKNSEKEAVPVVKKKVKQITLPKISYSDKIDSLIAPPKSEEELDSNYLKFSQSIGEAFLVFLADCIHERNNFKLINITPHFSKFWRSKYQITLWSTMDSSLIEWSEKFSVHSKYPYKRSSMWRKEGILTWIEWVYWKSSSLKGYVQLEVTALLNADMVDKESIPSVWFEVDKLLSNLVWM